MSFAPRFTATNPITAALTRIERARGERTIRRDVLVREHRLSDRQALALGHVLDAGRLTIQDFATLCPGVNRRTGPTDPARHYRLAEAILRPGKEL